MDIVEILETIYTSNTAVRYQYIATFALVDVYGNIEETNVVVATNTRQTMDSMNWSNFIKDDVYLIADLESPFRHSALSQ